ncbi:MAG TPA: ABC transporter substrate-binding protein [Chitinophagaceae bacterium]
MKTRFIVLLIGLFLVSNASQAQSPERLKIAFFAPLYLDSAFESHTETYRYDKTFPKFLNPGLEFYQGAQLALDSLSKMNAPLEVFVYDTRGNQSIGSILNRNEMEQMDMIIAHAASADVRPIADVADKLKIPFISATLPNDAAITENPYYVILNPTLRTHAEGIYKYLQRYHSYDNVIYVTKNGAQEKQIKEYIQDMARTSTMTVQIEYRDLFSPSNTDALLNSLDSNRKNVVIVGSLDEAYGTAIAKSLAEISHTYPLTVIGMPTWDGIKEFSKPDYKKMEIVYGAPFNYNRPNSLAVRITKDFEEKVNGRPTDMYYRGYETMLRFALLLLDTKKDVASNLTRKGNYIFTQFDIQPVFLNKQNMTLDYFENKKLYFIKTVNGTTSVL